MGSVEINPRTKTMLSSKPMAALWREDLVPYRKLLRQLPLIMISRAAYKAYDFDLPRPAMWSSEVVMGLLRVKLGYKGVAIANLSEVGVAASNTGMGEAAVKALGAGCDLLIVPGNKLLVEGTLRAVGAAIDSGRISNERIQESLNSIQVMKKQLARPLRAISERILRQANLEIRELGRQLRENA
jgi:beta-N-acetylhexosaminidase